MKFRVLYRMGNGDDWQLIDAPDKVNSTSIIAASLAIRQPATTCMRIVLRWVAEDELVVHDQYIPTPDNQCEIGFGDGDYFHPKRSPGDFDRAWRRFIERSRRLLAIPCMAVEVIGMNPDKIDAGDLDIRVTSECETDVFLVTTETLSADEVASLAVDKFNRMPLIDKGIENAVVRKCVIKREPE
jgi:hypothetical protein